MSRLTLITHANMNIAFKIGLLLLLTLSSTPRLSAASFLVSGPYGGSDLFLDTVGYSFTVGSNALSASRLGVADPTGTGLLSTTKIGLWRENGELVASKSLPAGTSAPLANFFRWMDLDSPVTLEANATYRIGAQASNDAWFTGYLPGYGGNQYGTSISTDVTFNGSVRNGDTYSFTYPDSAPLAGTAIIGPNLSYTLAVPEPSTFVLLGFGAIIAPIIVAVKKRRIFLRHFRRSSYDARREATPSYRANA